MRTLVAFLLLCGTAYAAPPTLSEVHTFLDPVFVSTVVCDSEEQVRNIASSPDPSSVFDAYHDLINDAKQPTCVAAYPFTAAVSHVSAIGTMHWSTEAFHAWVVEFKAPSGTFYALYLEQFTEVRS